jgi:hypothetical protein
MLELGLASEHCMDEKCLAANTKTLYLDICTVVISKVVGSDKLQMVLFDEHPQDYWRHFISISGWENVSISDIEVRQASGFGSQDRGQFELMILRKVPQINPIFLSFNSDWSTSKGSALNHSVEGLWTMRYNDGQFLILLNRRQLYVLEHKQLVANSLPLVTFDEDFTQFEVCRLGSVLLLNAERTGLYFMNTDFQLEKLTTGLTEIELVDTSHGHFIVRGKGPNGEPAEHYVQERKNERPVLLRLKRESQTTPLVTLELANFFVFGYDNTTEILYKNSRFGSITSAKRMELEVLVAVIHKYQSPFQNIAGLVVPKKERPSKPTLYIFQFNLLSGWVYCVPGNNTVNLTEMVNTRLHIKTLRFPIGVTVNFLPNNIAPSIPKEVQRQSDVGSSFKPLLYLLSASLLVILLTVLFVFKCYILKRQKEVIRVQELIFNVAPPDFDVEQGIKSTLGFDKTQAARPSSSASCRRTRPTCTANQAQPGPETRQQVQEEANSVEFSVQINADPESHDQSNEEV